MLSKDILVEIDTKSWKSKPRPAWAQKVPSMQSIDIDEALLLLGNITTPNGISAASPERYWACVRYFSACANSPDLRIRLPFTGLDPHQKSILSDDFGVAVSTRWLIQQFGGVKDIVDGRQFIINLGIPKTTKKLAKVGPTKCPDFVIEDKQGKFHVLECKGTQSGRQHLDRAMRTGAAQKKGIKIKKNVRGEALVIGLSIESELSSKTSRLVVIDPEMVPLTTVHESNVREARSVMARIGLARALNLTGFSEMASEIALPQNIGRADAEFVLLTSTEKLRLTADIPNRQKSWSDEANAELKTLDARTKEGFVVQTMQFEVPAMKLDSGRYARRVTVRRGVDAALVNRLLTSGSALREAANSEAESLAGLNEGMTWKRSESVARLEYRNLFFSDIAFD